MLHQMEEEKKLNKRIYQLDQESWGQQERLKQTLQGDIYDQSMNKRRADIDGQAELKKQSTGKPRQRGIQLTDK